MIRSVLCVAGIAALQSVTGQAGGDLPTWLGKGGEIALIGYLVWLGERKDARVSRLLDARYSQLINLYHRTLKAIEKCTGPAGDPPVDDDEAPE